MTVEEIKEKTNNAEFIKTSDASKVLGVSRQWVHRLIKRGDIKARLIGGYNYVTAEDLADYIANNN